MALWTGVESSLELAPRAAADLGLLYEVPGMVCGLYQILLKLDSHVTTLGWFLIALK